LLARVFAVGAFVIISFVLGSLLEGELARAWIAKVRGVAKRDFAKTLMPDVRRETVYQAQR